MTSATINEKRIGRIGGSDVAAIMGLSPYSTPLDVYRACTEGIVQPDNEPMRWGRLMEPQILSDFCARTGQALETQVPIQHPELPFFNGTLDAKLHRAPRGVEAKTVRQISDWEGTLPPYYLAQVQAYLAMAPDLEAIEVVALCRSSLEVTDWVVERDPAWIADIEKAVHEFWFGHVEPKEPPPAQARDRQALLTLAGNVRDKQLLSASPTVLSLVDQRAALREQMRESEEALASVKREMDLIDGQLAQVLAQNPGHEGFALPDGKRVKLVTNPPKWVEGYQSKGYSYLLYPRK